MSRTALFAVHAGLDKLIKLPMILGVLAALLIAPVAGLWLRGALQ